LAYTFPLEFRGELTRVSGQCQNISETGLMARFRSPLELWTNGELWCNTGVFVLELRVRIVRATERDAGMVFRFRDERERAAVRSVVEFAESRAGLASGRPPF